MRMFFPQELDSYLEWSGFNIIHKYGGFEEESFNDNSEKQVFVFQTANDAILTMIPQYFSKQTSC
jgi:hypothetical protein